MPPGPAVVHTRLDIGGISRRSAAEPDVVAAVLEFFTCLANLERGVPVRVAVQLEVPSGRMLTMTVSSHACPLVTGMALRHVADAALNNSAAGRSLPSAAANGGASAGNGPLSLRRQLEATSSATASTACGESVAAAAGSSVYYANFTVSAPPPSSIAYGEAVVEPAGVRDFAAGNLAANMRQLGTDQSAASQDAQDLYTALLHALATSEAVQNDPESCPDNVQVVHATAGDPVLETQAALSAAPSIQAPAPTDGGAADSSSGSAVLIGGIVAAVVIIAALAIVAALLLAGRFKRRPDSRAGSTSSVSTAMRRRAKAKFAEGLERSSRLETASTSGGSNAAESAAARERHLLGASDGSVRRKALPNSSGASMRRRELGGAVRIPTHRRLAGGPSSGHNGDLDVADVGSDGGSASNSQTSAAARSATLRREFSLRQASKPDVNVTLADSAEEGSEATALRRFGGSARRGQSSRGRNPARSQSIELADDAEATNAAGAAALAGDAAVSLAAAADADHHDCDDDGDHDGAGRRARATIARGLSSQFGAGTGSGKYARGALVRAPSRYTPSFVPGLLPGAGAGKPGAVKKGRAFASKLAAAIISSGEGDASVSPGRKEADRASRSAKQIGAGGESTGAAGGFQITNPARTPAAAGSTSATVRVSSSKRSLGAGSASFRSQKSLKGTGNVAVTGLAVSPSSASTAVASAALTASLAAYRSSRVVTGRPAAAAAHDSSVQPIRPEAIDNSGSDDGSNNSVGSAVTPAKISRRTLPPASVTARDARKSAVLATMLKAAYAQHAIGSAVLGRSSPLQLAAPASAADHSTPAVHPAPAGASAAPKERAAAAVPRLAVVVASAAARKHVKTAKSGTASAREYDKAAHRSASRSKSRSRRRAGTSSSSGSDAPASACDSSAAKAARVKKPGVAKRRLASLLQGVAAIRLALVATKPGPPAQPSAADAAALSTGAAAATAAPAAAVAMSQATLPASVSDMLGIPELILAARPIQRTPTTAGAAAQQAAATLSPSPTVTAAAAAREAAVRSSSPAIPAPLASISGSVALSQLHPPP